MKIKINHGCGSIRPKEWINTDSSINANLRRIPVIGNLLGNLINSVKYESDNFIYANLNKKWRFKNDEVDIIYASHLFEHLSVKAAALFIEESKRTLKSGGVIRIVVPDLYKICVKYVQEYDKNTFEGRSTDFIMWAINMHREGQYGKINLMKALVLEIIGYPHQHKFMYDEKSLSNILLEAGFTELRICEYGESKYIDEIHEVEGFKESYLSVYLEAKKP
jgi:predicted SAM-dependent methyltransferase